MSSASSFIFSKETGLPVLGLITSVLMIPFGNDRELSLAPTVITFLAVPGGEIILSRLFGLSPSLPAEQVQASLYV